MRYRRYVMKFMDILVSQGGSYLARCNAATVKQILYIA